MSYEGTEVYLCPAGHTWEVDVAWVLESPEVCGACGRTGDVVFSIDQTNGLPYYLPGYLEETHPAEVDICPHCRAANIVSHSRFRYVECNWTCWDGEYRFIGGCSPDKRFIGWNYYA